MTTYREHFHQQLNLDNNIDNNFTSMFQTAEMTDTSTTYEEVHKVIIELQNNKAHENDKILV